MRVVCISDKIEWDDAYPNINVKKGRIYTVIDERMGYGRYRWWPFSAEMCYELAEFGSYFLFPIRNFIEILEEEIDEMELINKKEAVG